MVNVRPSSRTVSTFTLRREGRPDAPRVAAAGVGVHRSGCGAGSDEERDESETAWRLRHLKRSILKDAATLAEIPAEDDFFLTDSLQLLGRAVESSARMAGALFTHSPLQGQVNLLTTGVFDSSGRVAAARAHARRRVLLAGAPVGEHGDWTVKAALNQGDLSSWILAGNYVTRNPARHRYQFGMSYGVHRYEGGNAAALAAMPEAARNVGAVYAHDEWTVSDRLTIGYGAHYAHYDYLLRARALQPAAERDDSASDGSHAHSRGRGAPASPRPAPRNSCRRPTRQVLPPQRTFAPLTRAGFLPEDMRHYEVAVEHVARRRDHRRPRVPSDDRRSARHRVRAARDETRARAELGHYFVGSAGDVDVVGLGVTLHARARRQRARHRSTIRSPTPSGRTARRAIAARLARSVPAALRDDGERIHDVTTSLETEFPQSATRVFLLYKMNSGYIRADAERGPVSTRRWDVQVSQGLPFMNFTERRLGNARRRPQSVPRSVHRNVRLRRAARRPPTQARSSAASPSSSERSRSDRPARDPRPSSRDTDFGSTVD